MAGSLIVDYGLVADYVSAEQYVRDVVAGKRFDSNLSKQLHKGFTVRRLIPNYSTDQRSLGWGVEIVWHNPDYREKRRFSLPGKPAPQTGVWQPVGA